MDEINIVFLAGRLVVCGGSRQRLAYNSGELKGGIGKGLVYLTRRGFRQQL
jgi:hypothetical protein